MVLPSKDSTISLPSVRSILDETRPPRSVPTFDRASDGRDTSGPPSQISDEQFREVNGRASTPSLMSLGARHMYPSPSHSSDDLHDDSEMVDGDGSGWWGTTQKPLFQISQPVPDVSKQIDLPDVNMAKPDDGVTPTIVHYRPNGIPSVRSGRKQSAGEVPKVRKSSRQENEEFKVRLVKWDRTTDKGTAPLLNVERRSTGPRTCTLCYISKRKCERLDGQRPNTTHPCAACQKNNFVCQFISPSQLRDGTTQPPSLESLKLYCDQAQRLRTKDLEEKVVHLETQLELASMENRVQTGYIANLRVYETIMNGYIMKLRERLEQLDPKNRLLEYHIPAMPEKGSLGASPDSEPAMDLLSEVIDGTDIKDFTETIGLPVVERMDLEE